LGVTWRDGADPSDQPGTELGYKADGAARRAMRRSQLEGITMHGGTPFSRLISLGIADTLPF
jgi:hypothetical protein